MQVIEKLPVVATTATMPSPPPFFVYGCKASIDLRIVRAALTPHTAFYSVEALEELQTKCASDVARVLSGEKAIYPISA